LVRVDCKLLGAVPVTALAKDLIPGLFLGRTEIVADLLDPLVHLAKQRLVQSNPSSSFIGPCHDLSTLDVCLGHDLEGAERIDHLLALHAWVARNDQVLVWPVGNGLPLT
jgi:hypothetical protein